MLNGCLPVGGGRPIEFIHATVLDSGPDRRAGMRF